MARSPLALSALSSAVALLALNGTATPAQAGLDLSINLNFGLGFDWCEPAPCHAAPVWDGWVDDVYCEPTYVAPISSWCAPVTRVETYTSYDRWGTTYRSETYTYGSPSYRGWNRWRGGWDDCDDYRWSRPYGYRSGWSLGYSSGWGGSGFSFSYSSRPSYGWGSWGSRHWSRPAFYCPPPVVIYRPVVVQPVVVHRPVVINQTPVVINNNPVVINNNPPIIRGSDRDRGGFDGPVAQNGASGQVVEVSANGGNGIGVDGSLPNGMDRRANPKPNRAVAQPTAGPEAKPVDPRPIAVKPIESGRRPSGKPGRAGNVIDDRGNLVGPMGKPASREDAKPIAQPQRQPETAKPLPSVFDKPQEVRPAQQVKPVEQVRPIETGKPGTIRRPIRGGDFNVINRPAADNTGKPSLPNGVREIKPAEPQAVPQPQPQAQPQQVKPMPSVFDKPQEMPAAKPIVRTRDRQAPTQQQFQKPAPQPQKWPERFEQIGPRGEKPAMPQAPVDAGKPIRRAVPQPAMVQPQVKPFAQPQPQPQPSKPIAQPSGKDKRDGK